MHAVGNPQRAGRSRTVVFQSNVPGTSFSEAGQPLSLASELSEGNHNVEAFHDGYMPEVKSFTVAAARAPLSVKFDLQPMLSRLRVSSSIESGKLLLDEVEPLDLRSGAANKDALAPGPHTVKIYDRGRLAFAFAFRVESHQKPLLITPLLTQPVAGAVVSSLAGSATIYTTRGLRAAPLHSGRYLPRHWQPSRSLAWKFPVQTRTRPASYSRPAKAAVHCCNRRIAPQFPRSAYIWLARPKEPF